MIAEWLSRAVHTLKQRRHPGQVLILTAVGMTVLLGFVAVSVDVGYALNQRRGLQTAADASALAVAEAVMAGATNQGVFNNTANSYVAGNGFQDANASVVVAGPTTARTVTVDLKSDVPKFFIGVVYHGGWKVSAHAVATVRQKPGNYALLVLDESGYPAQFQGNTSLKVIGGGAMSNAGMQCKGNAIVRADETIDANTGFKTQNNCSFNGTKGSNPSAAIVPDPLKDVRPPDPPEKPSISDNVTCSGSGDNYTCPPGVISNGPSVGGINGSITFQAGNHEIDNTEVKAGGVNPTITLYPGTYYFHNSSIKLSGTGGSLVFKPGKYLFYMDDHSSMSFRGNSKGFDASDVESEFYFKDSSVTFDGNTDTTLPPGIYYFDGQGPTLNGNKKVTGDNVLFFFDNGATLYTDGNTAYRFTAASTSLYDGGQDGMLIYAARGSTGTFITKGNSDSFMGGIVYLPSATLKLGGNPSGTWAEGQMIVDQITNDGNPHINIKYKDYVDIGESRVYLTQ